MTTTLRRLNLSVTFADVELDNVLSARGQVSVNGGWPSCSVFVTAKPATGNEEDTLSVVAGAGNNITRFTGRVRKFRPSGFPKSIEIVGSGTLSYANEWGPDQDLRFRLEWPSGATDEQLVAWALDKVPGVTYLVGNLTGTGIVLGARGAPDAFDWKKGTSAWSYIQALDRATLFRTYQARDGTIYRVRMIGHPNTTTDFTLANADLLDGSSATRDTERTRNAMLVQGYGYGPVQMLGTAYGSNDFQGDGSDAATRYAETFNSSLIESGYDAAGTFHDLGGLNAQDIADATIDDTNKEFVEASVQSWRDDTHGPGMTCLLDALDRLGVGEPMWVQQHAWEVGDNGWTATYSLTGGGLPRLNPAPPV